MNKISRSKIELFLDCPRCFWLEVRGGVKRPPPAPYTINNAVDYLLKQEFDIHREKGTPHPIMEEAGIDAVPLNVPEMGKWRHNFTGVQFQDPESGFLVFGAVDDIWVNPKGELLVVDYKATGANQHQIYDSYRRQMEIYQWLVAHNNHVVSPTGYFVFARVSKAKGFGMPESVKSYEGEGGKAVLPFDIFVESIEGDRSWIPETLKDIKEIYNEEQPPAARSGCLYCTYARESSDFRALKI